MRTTGGMAADLRRMFLSILEDMFGMMPGSIVSYDDKTRLATVQPALQRRYKGDDLPTDLPAVQRVLIVQPQTKNAQSRLPVDPGDKVTMFFADRAIDNWLAGNGEAKTSNDVRMHALDDAFAFLGAWPPGADGATDDDPGAAIMQNMDAEIKIRKDSTIEIGKRTLGAAGNKPLLDWIDGFIGVFQTFVPVPNDGGAKLVADVLTYVATNPVPKKLRVQ